MLHRYLLIRQYFAGDQDSYDRWMPRLEKLMEFTALNLAPTGVNCPFNDCGRGTSLANLLLGMGECSTGATLSRRIAGAGSGKGLLPRKCGRAPRGGVQTSFPIPIYAVMRTGWNPESYFMMINYGPFANHAHYDILDFEIFANGIPWLSMPASASRATAIHPRLWYKGSESHNMLTVDEAICVKRDIEGEGVVWAAQDFCDYFAPPIEAISATTAPFAGGILLLCATLIWLIIDQVSTPKSGQKLDWQPAFAPDAETRRRGICV